MAGLQRVGQDIFRAALLDYWGGRCPLTGIADPGLLRASHIVPWAECDTDVHNGLLLSALWDAAFDGGLVSFADDGTVLTAASSSHVAEAALNSCRKASATVALTAAHQLNMPRHRLRHGFSLDPHDI
jgi:predicted restriction endonuclease